MRGRGRTDDEENEGGSMRNRIGRTKRTCRKRKQTEIKNRRKKGGDKSRWMSGY